MGLEILIVLRQLQRLVYNNKNLLGIGRMLQHKQTRTISLKKSHPGRMSASKSGCLEISQKQTRFLFFQTANKFRKKRARNKIVSNEILKNTVLQGASFLGSAKSERFSFIKQKDSSLATKQHASLHTLFLLLSLVAFISAC